MNFRERLKNINLEGDSEPTSNTSREGKKRREKSLKNIDIEEIRKVFSRLEIFEKEKVKPILDAVNDEVLGGKAQYIKYFLLHFRNDKNMQFPAKLDPKDESLGLNDYQYTKFKENQEFRRIPGNIIVLRAGLVWNFSSSTYEYSSMMTGDPRTMVKTNYDAIKVELLDNGKSWYKLSGNSFVNLPEMGSDEWVPEAEDAVIKIIKSKKTGFFDKTPLGARKKTYW